MRMRAILATIPPPRTSSPARSRPRVGGMLGTPENRERGDVDLISDVAPLVVRTSLHLRSSLCQFVWGGSRVLSPLHGVASCKHQWLGVGIARKNGPKPPGVRAPPPRLDAGPRFSETMADPRGAPPFPAARTAAKVLRRGSPLRWVPRLGLLSVPPERATSARGAAGGRRDDRGPPAGRAPLEGGCRPSGLLHRGAPRVRAHRAGMPGGAI
jgi:hypothetical protein